MPTQGSVQANAARRELRHLPEGVADKLDQFAAEHMTGDPKAPPRQGKPAAGKTASGNGGAGKAVSGQTGKGPAGRQSSKPVGHVPATPALPVPAAAHVHQAGRVRAGEDEVKQAIASSRSAFIGIGILSFLINILMLTGPLFMLQVYDRVMTSGSLSTLLALAMLTAVLYAMTGFFDLVRTRIVSRVSVEIDQRLSDRIFKASLRRSLFKQGASISALRDLDTVRQFASGPAPMIFFDAPWTPIYLLVIFMVHWVLGLAALAGAALILVLTLLSERTAREPLAEANKSAMKSLDMADSAQRNVEALAAMGMIEAYRKRWQNASSEALAWQINAADRIGSMASFGKAVRLLLQSMMLAIGAALAISGDISSGSIIAGTIIFGRALAPVEQGVGQWKSFVKARESFAKLRMLLKEEPEPPLRTALPAPRGLLEVAQLRVAAPDTRKLILANLNFTVKPGELCAVIGPSASGKSTLARTLVGLWPPFSGSISIDGAELQQWNPEALGRYIGYLPQDVELFSGTVRENISRFRDDAVDDAVIEAARMAHAHEMILALPQGYDTQLGSFGTYLSAGQRQRIGLARALFGNPVFLVLDEPNANLDRLGDEALTSALAGMKKRGQAVVLISHRVQAMGLADTLLYVDRGVQRAFGPQAEVMKLFRQAGPGGGGPAQAQGGAPVQGQPQPKGPAQGQPNAAPPQRRAEPPGRMPPAKPAPPREATGPERVKAPNGDGSGAVTVPTEPVS
jgi:PrtD family type I secretion system ABC transporter